MKPPFFFERTLFGLSFIVLCHSLGHKVEVECTAINIFPTSIYIFHIHNIKVNNKTMLKTK